MTRLRVERFKRLMTQQQMARELGIPAPALSRLENRHWIKCPRGYEPKLREYFNLSFGELMVEVEPERELSPTDRLEVWGRVQRIAADLKGKLAAGLAADLRRARGEERAKKREVTICWKR